MLLGVDAVTPDTISNSISMSRTWNRYQPYHGDKSEVECSISANADAGLACYNVLFKA